MSGSLVLIACSASKRPGTNRFAAEVLYTGSLFAASLAAARNLTEDHLIRILSARHGFVRLTTFRRIPHSYDQRWGQSREIAARWLVDQTRWLPPHSEVVSLMPAAYTRRAREALVGDPSAFLDAMRGIRGIGDMRHRLATLATQPTPTRRSLDTQRSPIDQIAGHGIGVSR